MAEAGDETCRPSPSALLVKVLTAYCVCDRWLLSYPVVYLLDADHIDAAARALSSGDIMVVQLYVPALVRASKRDLPEAGLGWLVCWLPAVNICCECSRQYVP